MSVSRHLAGCVLLCVLATVMSGCASIGVPVPPSLELPKPPTDLRASRKGDKVYLSWSIPTKTTDHQNVRRPGPTRICRSLSAMMSQCDTPVGNVAPTKESTQAPHAPPNEKLEASFTDTLAPDLQNQNATRLATYAVEPMNLDARSAGLSNQVQVALAPTLPPPANFSAQVEPKEVRLTWAWTAPKDNSPATQYSCRIYRKLADNGAETRLPDVACSELSDDDRTIEWQKTYEYRIAVVTFATLQKGALPCERNSSDQGIVAIPDCIQVAEVQGDDSPPVKVFTNDIYPPAVPTGLQAVFSGPGQAPFIDLVWAPDLDADLAGYNVYRHEENGPPQKINRELVKTPSFRDTNLTQGKTYFYIVTAVDLRGNESARSDEASETVPKN